MNIAFELRKAAMGVEEWRVADPETGCYCIAFSHSNSLNPQRAATGWLEDHRELFPGSHHAHYEVLRVMVQEQTDDLMNAAADEIDRLRGLMRRIIEDDAMHDRSDGNAPGHCHHVPGVWDSDNGEKAGKPCAWCALWVEAKATILTPNVEVTGAARLYRAASGGLPGSAYTRRVATAMHEDLCDVLREHGKNSEMYARQLGKASRVLRRTLPEILEVFVGYSSSSLR